MRPGWGGVEGVTWGSASRAGSGRGVAAMVRATSSWGIARRWMDGMAAGCGDVVGMGMGVSRLSGMDAMREGPCLAGVELAEVEASPERVCSNNIAVVAVSQPAQRQ